MQDGGDKVLVLNKTGQYIEFQSSNTTTCINNIANCSLGFKFYIKLKFIEISTNKLFILSSLKEEHSGIEMYYLNGSYFVKIVSSKHSWSLIASFETKVNIWYTYRIEWSPISGLLLYVNNILIGNAFATQTNVNLLTQSLVIGSSHLIDFSYTSHVLITGMKEIIKPQNGNLSSNHNFDTKTILI